MLHGTIIAFNVCVVKVEVLYITYRDFYIYTLVSIGSL